MAENKGTSVDSSANCGTSACTSDSCSNCMQPISAAGCDQATDPHPGSSYSAEPVRYSNGDIHLVTKDLSFKSFGIEWGHTRSYGNRVTDPGSGQNGNSWFVKEWPYLVQVDPDATDPNQPKTISLVWVIDNTLWFDWNQSKQKYIGRFSRRPVLLCDSVNGQFKLVDSLGRVTKFFDFSLSHPAELRGQFKSYTDQAGRETMVEYDEDQLIISFVQQAGDIRSGYYYEYYESGSNTGRLSKVTYEVNNLKIQRAVYTYYNEGGSHGSDGDLKKVVIEKFSHNHWSSLSKTYYRYYKNDSHSGVKHGLRFVLSPLGYEKMVGQGITPEIATNEQIANYAMHEFRYNSDRSVREETVNSGTANYTFQRTTRGALRSVARDDQGALITINPQSDLAVEDYNSWNQKTIETTPEGNRRIVYTNFAGMPIFSVFIWMHGLNATNKRWYEHFQYDSAGRVVLRAESSAVSGYDENIPSLAILKENAGLLHIIEYYSSTNQTGSAVGRKRYEMVQKGAAGSPVKVKEWQYVSRLIDDCQISVPSMESNFLRDEAGGSEPSVTSYSYSWLHLQIAQKATTWPVVPVEQNGSGLATTLTEVFDPYGRLQWTKDERGCVNGYVYDSATDARILQVQDVASGGPWPIPPGPHLNLFTEYSADDQGRVIEELGPPHHIDVQGTIVYIRRAKWIIYDDHDRKIIHGKGYQDINTGGYRLINPVQISVYDEAGRLEHSIQAVRSNISGKLLPEDTFFQPSWVRWTHNIYLQFSDVAAQRVYVSIPPDGEGQRGQNFNETTYTYNPSHRKVRECTPRGTIIRYVYNPNGLLIQKWVGTNDIGANDMSPAGIGSPENNMRIAESYQYDNGMSGRDGNLTAFTQWISAVDERTVKYVYDWRNRRIAERSPLNLWSNYRLNNAGEITQIKQRQNGTTGTLVAFEEWRRDTRGRIWRSKRFSVAPSSGIIGSCLTDAFWFDESGNVIKRKPLGKRSFEKTRYDAIGRRVGFSITLDNDESQYADAASISDDAVIEEWSWRYDAASNVTMEVHGSRLPNGSGNGSLLEGDDAALKCRVDYLAIWPDALGRKKSIAAYGTNEESPFERPDSPPSTSDKVHVSTMTFNERGEAFEFKNYAGAVKQKTYNDAAQIVQELYGYIPEGADHANQKRINFCYTPDGLLSSQTVVNDETGNQVTHWDYGTVLPSSDIASTLLVFRKIYPNGDTVVVDRNRLGEITKHTSNGGTVHEYRYDGMGRVLVDSVTSVAPGIDSTIRRIEYAYDVNGSISDVHTFDVPDIDVGDVVSAVRFEWNGYGQITKYHQSHHGMVSSGSTPNVQYSYAVGADDCARVESLSYPTTTIISYSYGESGGVDDLLDRVSTVHTDSNAPAVSYSYLGENMIVGAKYYESGVGFSYYELSNANSEPSILWTGLDQFNRVIDHCWRSRIDGTIVDRSRFKYNVSSDPTERLCQADGLVSRIETMAYDGFSQLQYFSRQTMLCVEPPITAEFELEENTVYDATGNWKSYIMSAHGSEITRQTRIHTPANNIDAIEGGDRAFSYSSGKLTETANVENWMAVKSLKYNAWDQLVEVSDMNGGLVRYEYDGMGRMITSARPGDDTRHLYYSINWQVIEERLEGPGAAERQFVWGLRHIDDLVFRYRSYPGFRSCHYALDDSKNVTAVIDLDGLIVERYTYSAFGTPSIEDSSSNDNSDSALEWETLFAGYRYDTACGLYLVRNRCLYPELGRWTSWDPIGEQAGENLNAYVDNASRSLIDPYGLDWRSDAYFRTVWEASMAAVAASNNEGYVKIPGGDYSKREYCGLICCGGTWDNPVYSFTSPHRGYFQIEIVGKRRETQWTPACDPDNLMEVQNNPKGAVVCSPGTRRVSSYHSHPGGDDFSVNDYQWGVGAANKGRAPMSIGTPSGVKWWDPRRGLNAGSKVPVPVDTPITVEPPDKK